MHGLLRALQRGVSCDFERNQTMKLYAEISKVEDQDDGTIKVWGWASSESVDSDGETITADAMKAALPDYMKFGAVREMHQAKAAGTAIEIVVNEEGKKVSGKTKTRLAGGKFIITVNKMTLGYTTLRISPSR